MSTLQGSLISFYSGQSPDAAGRMIDTILCWDDSKLEEVHDYIQWLFPLQEKSDYNPLAPIINEEEIKTFQNNDNLKEKLTESFARLLNFYGFGFNESEDQHIVICSDNFQHQSRNWLTKYNHNHLRITRILKCLSLLGLKDYASAFMKVLEVVYDEYPQIVGTETLSYWRKAVR